MTSYELRATRELHDLLRRQCRSEIEALHADANATGSIVILADPTGLILDTVGSADFTHRAAQVALSPGAPWNEAATGTNAIGAALIERQPTEVRGAEHFFEPHSFLNCAASPIVGPVGELVGVLDLSGPAVVPQLHALGLVRLAVDEIEHRLFGDTFPGRRILRFHADQSFLGTPREGVLVFEEDRLVAANRHGLRLLRLDWCDVGARRLGELFAGHPERLGEGGMVRGQDGTRFMAAFERSAARLVPGATLGQRDGWEPHFDDATRAALGRAVRLVDANVPVMVQGETGSGKEVFAREVHRLCRRAGRPFIAVNCAALPETLIESELFGYEEGAFTGARRKGYGGLLREADGGVLFLDEIGDMPLSSQSRLLRVLQEREVTPLGGARPVSVDFALVCASHRDLLAMIEARTFRQDLYFRIAQYTVELPPLRAVADRRALVRDCWTRLAPSGPALAQPTFELLAAYEWPGNFRQFIGTLRALLALADPNEAIMPALLPSAIRQARSAAAATSIEEGLQAITRHAMMTALEASSGNVSKAARRLGVHRSTLHRHLHLAKK
jgi:transcriptional regulator of acetoin/glycerol metabolism